MSSADIGLMTEEIAACTESDYVVVADAESSEAFEKAVTEVNRNMETRDGGETSVEYDTTEAALKEHPEVNLVHIAVPGDCALEEAKKALNAGKHICVFSNNVPFADEREMKELARGKRAFMHGPGLRRGQYQRGGSGALQHYQQGTFRHRGSFRNGNPARGGYHP